MLSNRDLVSLRNRSRGRLLCPVSYCSCQFERQTEGTFQAFLISIHPKNGLEVRTVALLRRPQFFFAFRRERFVAVNGRFFRHGLSSSNGTNHHFFVDAKRKERKMTPLPRLKTRPRRKSIEAGNGLFSSSMNAPVSFPYAPNAYAKTLKRRSISHLVTRRCLRSS